MKKKKEGEPSDLSAYLNWRRDHYDKEVYENTCQNWLKIIAMLLFFYLWNALHWWANFALGIHESSTSTWYNIFIFISAVLVISVMLVVGAGVNRKKLTHEFYAEKISEEKIKQAEKQARANAKAAAEAKRL